MNRWKLALGAVAILTSAFAVAATSMEEPVRLVSDGTALPGSGDPFGCGAWCGDDYIVVGYCFEPQQCCGYIICSSGSSQLTCCNPGLNL